jgi:Rad3-related DNA helicase/serine/threonine protein kinase
MLQVELPRIGPYAPVRPLGEGSTTATHLYRHEQRKKYAVIKITRAPLTSLEEKEAFLTRAKRLQKLKHRNITEIQGFGFLQAGEPADDYGYVVAQYTEGGNVRERFMAGQSYPPDEVRRALFPLADALQYAHALHITHGNLHPGNILREKEKDFFLLSDFALTLPAQAISLPLIDEALLYRAPEQLRGGAATLASDQYALAVMVYEWLCGRRPYLATTPEALLIQQENEPIPAPSSFNAEIKPLVERALLQALAPDPEQRFAQTLSFADTYLRALMGLPPSPQPGSSVAKKNDESISRPATIAALPEISIQDMPAAVKKSTSLKKSAAAAEEPASYILPPQPAAKESSRISSLAAQITQEIETEPERLRASQPELLTRLSAAKKSETELPETPAPRPQPLSYETIADLARRVENDLHQGGALSLALSGYEERLAQIEMAGVVSRAITENTPAIIEAATGTGKSLAYLVPIVRSGKVAIVSTANKALQEQLFFKDIPFVQKHIRHFDAALVKGMSNYICLDRVDQERVGIQHYVKNRDFTRLLERIEESDEHFAGDFETLGFALPADVRGKINADRDQCTWSKCSYFSECYVRKMKARAGQASVIVVNHTLLLLDAFMEGNLLPERDVIVIDEAHHLEDEATRAFTTTISQGQVSTLLAQHLLKDHTPPSLQDETRATMSLAWERLAAVTDPGYKGRANLKEPLQEGLRLASTLKKLADALRTGRPKQMTEKDEQLFDKLVTRAQNLAEDVRRVFAVDQPLKYVYYVERVMTGGRRGSQQMEVSAAPLEVTSWLKEQLFDKSNVICTSATLATIGPDPARPEVKGPNFAYFRRRVGLDANDYPAVQERILPLTFDYVNRALLYLPRHLPEPAYGTGPAAQEYSKAIGREMMKLVEISRGRAFLLFSSKRMLDEVYELFQSELPAQLTFPLLRQGDMTRMELVRSFREREGAVLFGLKSFWEGVDIAGEALSLVVIDKLPFDPPDDPVHEARVAQMKAAGENWFSIYVLPQAVLRLKQGLGRLLRTHDDRGVMAILDTRLHTKGYGKQIVRALPPARRAMTLEAVARFFQEDNDDDEAPF